MDIWAEDCANALGVPTDIKTPTDHSWGGEYGYKARNLDIARDSDMVHVIVADVYPEDYVGRRFKLCYHCKDDNHVKSGGCWTGKKALAAGKMAAWHIIPN